MDDHTTCKISLVSLLLTNSYQTITTLRYPKRQQSVARGHTMIVRTKEAAAPDPQNSVQLDYVESKLI